MVSCAECSTHAFGAWSRIKFVELEIVVSSLVIPALGGDPSCQTFVCGDNHDDLRLDGSPPVRG